MTALDTSIPDQDLATGPTRCRHCGDACRSGAVTSPSGVFCCAGCESVYLLLHAHGLADYYRCEIAPGVSQRQTAGAPDQRFAALDDEAVASRFVTRFGNDLSRVTFSIPALHCASCLWLLERIWRVESGVTRSEAHLLHRSVTVEFKPSRTGPRRIAERLAALGYEPVIDAEALATPVPRVRRRLYLRLGVAGFAFGNVMLFSIPRYANGAPLEPFFQAMFDALNVLFALPVLLFSAADYFRGAWRSARTRTITLDAPIAIGLAALFGRSLFEIVTRTGEGFLDSFTGLVFFLLIGKLFQQKAFDRLAFDRTARSFLPLSVVVERGPDAVLTPIDRLRAGDVVVLRHNEVVPADGVLLDEDGAIDFAFVTGEQAAVQRHRGDIVIAGGRVVGRTLRLSLARPVSHSALARLWTHPVFAAPKRVWLDDVLAHFGRWFTVAALMLAAGGAMWWWPDARRAVEVATAVLIIACPCAFTLAAPLTLGTAMGALGRAGIFLKSPAVALDLSRVTAVAFDKTGTLTTSGRETSVRFHGRTGDEARLIGRLAAQSSHPVSRAIAGAISGGDGIDDVIEVAGLGLRGTVDGRAVVLGSAAFIGAVTAHHVPAIAGVTWAAIDGDLPQPIEATTPERPGAAAAATAVARDHETWLLSGDDAAAERRWSAVFGERMRFRQSPEDKLDAIREWQARGHRVLMVGDGLNDAGALAAADVGIAVSDSTACLVPACDAIIAGDRLPQLDAVLAYARRARTVIVLCFAVSIVYNVGGLALALTGRLTPLATAILMPVSSLTIVGLSAGLMRRGPRLEPRP
ncbi:MAG TPA: heavy metal translocating P-type ATPase metal-binding domain-containing protein [Vicinamibacterales bacterium]|nr:heavy metal translocating P-type ATPase metal-binding domain-containing protein [Vicinamibacterales bacterium]